MIGGIPADIPGMRDLYELTTKQVENEDLFEDLIESAYLAGQITGETQKFAYCWLAANLAAVRTLH